MSVHRVNPERGYIDQAKHPKGPNGRGLCRWCANEVGPGQRTFCAGSACVHEWKIRSNPGYAAVKVLERDCGVCAACGLDCIVLRQELTRLRAEERREYLRLGPHHPAAAGYVTLPGDYKMPRFAARLAELGLTTSRLRFLDRRLWEMDHIVPVSEGGGACGLENLRSLCWACHQKETTSLAARRAQSRKDARASKP